jgi:hypothetical protein
MLTICRLPESSIAPFLTKLAARVKEEGIVRPELWASPTWLTNCTQRVGRYDMAWPLLLPLTATKLSALPRSCRRLVR